MGREGNNELGESFTFSLEQAVTRLGALEFGLHNTQGLPCGEDGLAILSPPLIVSQRHGPGCGNCGGAARMGSYRSSRHVCDPAMAKVYSR